jgi:hypothetical protein
MNVTPHSGLAGMKASRTWPRVVALAWISGFSGGVRLAFPEETNLFGRSVSRMACCLNFMQDDETECFGNPLRNADGELAQHSSLHQMDFSCRNSAVRDFATHFRF